MLTYESPGLISSRDTFDTEVVSLTTLTTTCRNFRPTWDSKQRHSVLHSFYSGLSTGTYRYLQNFAVKRFEKYSFSYKMSYLYCLEKTYPSSEWQTHEQYHLKRVLESTPTISEMVCILVTIYRLRKVDVDVKF